MLGRVDSEEKREVPSHRGCLECPLETQGVTPWNGVTSIEQPKALSGFPLASVGNEHPRSGADGACQRTLP